MKEPIRTEKNFINFQFFLLCLSFFSVSYMTILITLVLLSSFQFTFILITVFNHHKRCSQTKLPGSTDQIPCESIWPLSSTRDKEKGTTWLQWVGENYTLTGGWDSFMSFLRAGLSKFVVWRDTFIFWLKFQI